MSPRPERPYNVGRLIARHFSHSFIGLVINIIAAVVCGDTRDSFVGTMSVDDCGIVGYRG